MTKRKHVNAIFTYDPNVSQFLSDAGTFYNIISTAPGNTWVTIPPASITAAQANITAARTAENNVGTGARGLADARDLAVGLVITDVRNFVGIVQTAANNAVDVATATTIVTECGLHTRKQTSKTKAGFTVGFDTSSAGLLSISFKAAAKGLRACYEIQESLDGINWLTVKTSTDARYTYAHGKPTGTKLYYRGRVILSELNGGAQPWMMPPLAFIYAL